MKGRERGSWSVPRGTRGDMFCPLERCYQNGEEEDWPLQIVPLGRLICD